MGEQLFRKVALERQSSPEKLDVLIRITSPAGWLSLLAIGGLLLCAVIWGFMGNIPIKVAGQGILMSAGGVYKIFSGSAGEVKGLYFEAGELIEKGRTVARLDQPELLARVREAAVSLKDMRADLERKTAGSPEWRALEDGIRQAERSLRTLQEDYEAFSKVMSPFTGRILELTVRTGEFVAKGTPLMSIELEGPQIGNMQVVMYFPAESGERSRQGMAVQIVPLGVEPSEYGFLQGLVTHVSTYPSSTGGMMRTLQNEALVQDLSRLGPVIEVIADLIPDPATLTGYKWSSSKGPATKLQTGTICLVSVTISKERVINLLFPSMKKREPGIE